MGDDFGVAGFALVLRLYRHFFMDWRIDPISLWSAGQIDS
jgi:hypothetical protein